MLPTSVLRTQTAGSCVPEGYEGGSLGTMSVGGAREVGLDSRKMELGRACHVGSAVPGALELRRRGGGAMRTHRDPLWVQMPLGRAWGLRGYCPVLRVIPSVEFSGASWEGAEGRACWRTPASAAHVRQTGVPISALPPTC